MTIAVEAGLGFESAMARAGRNGKGPLAEELVRTLQDIAVGQPRREAYLALADRTGVADLRRFIRAVVQADAYGVSIADVLRTQAQEMRLKRRQRAEEKAMQIPVKVIFPLILCILPTLFIVLLGPGRHGHRRRPSAAEPLNGARRSQRGWAGFVGSPCDGGFIGRPAVASDGLEPPRPPAVRPRRSPPGRRRRAGRRSSGRPAGSA